MVAECTKAHGPTQHDGGAVDVSINQLATGVEKITWSKNKTKQNKTRECIGEVRPLGAPDGEEDEPLLPSRRAAHRLGGSAHQRQAVARHRSLATARTPSIASTWDVNKDGEERFARFPKHSAADGGTRAPSSPSGRA